MATASRQHLPPCCHGVLLPRKDTTKVRFKTELTKYAVPSAKKDALPRLAAALTDARSALQLDRSGGASDAVQTSSKFQTMEEIQTYLTAMGEYLSLVQGFTVTAASLVSEAQPPMVGGSIATLDAAEAKGSPQAQAVLLRQPLIDTAATGVDLAASRSHCLSCCSWRDVLTNANAYAPNARVEAAQTLLACGLYLMQNARVGVDAMLATRVTEIPENELKTAYHLLLHAAGVFDACLTALDCTPQAIGANATDLRVVETHATTSETEKNDAALQQWRDDQRCMEDSSATMTEPLVSRLNTTTTTTPVTNDLAMLNRLPDLASGRFPQILAWVALAQAQELVILRGVSRDFVDYTLMAKLARDVGQRYSEAHTFAARHLPCATSAVAVRLQLYCAFKDAYYAAVSCYFQGAACMEKDDARHCAQAIADFKHAATLIVEANQRKTRFDAKAADEKDRLFAIKTVYVRAEQIIQRDLEIVTRRNDSIYYERIPEPEPPCDPISLVRAITFPTVEVHTLWHDADINTCLQATNPRTAAATAQANGATATAGSTTTHEGGRHRDGCCASCVVS